MFPFFDKQTDLLLFDFSNVETTNYYEIVRFSFMDNRRRALIVFVELSQQFLLFP